MGVCRGVFWLGIGPHVGLAQHALPSVAPAGLVALGLSAALGSLGIFRLQCTPSGLGVACSATVLSADALLALALVSLSPLPPSLMGWCFAPCLLRHPVADLHAWLQHSLGLDSPCFCCLVSASWPLWFSLLAVLFLAVACFVLRSSAVQLLCYSCFACASD